MVNSCAAVSTAEPTWILGAVPSECLNMDKFADPIPFWEQDELHFVIVFPSHSWWTRSFGLVMLFNLPSPHVPAISVIELDSMRILAAVPTLADRQGKQKSLEG